MLLRFGQVSYHERDGPLSRRARLLAAGWSGAGPASVSACTSGFIFCRGRGPGGLGGTQPPRDSGLVGRDLSVGRPRVVRGWPPVGRQNDTLPLWPVPRS